jgi:hypothetical protein
MGRPAIYTFPGSVMTFMIFDFVSSALNFVIPAMMGFTALYVAIAFVAHCSQGAKVISQPMGFDPAGLLSKSPSPNAATTPAPSPVAKELCQKIDTPLEAAKAPSPNALTIRQLKALASKAKVKGYSRLNKSQLIEALAL